MKHEFKTVKTENETRYVLETASAGATGAGAVASVSTALGAVRKRNISELETPSGSMFLKFITKQLPDQEQQVYGYAGFGTEPKDVKVANAKIKPFTVDSFDDIEFNIRRILSDKDFVGVEKIIVVPSNSVKSYLDDFENITGERVEIYQGNDDDDEEKIGKSIQHYVIGPDGKKKKVAHTKPKSQMGGRAVEQPKSFTYTLQQRELIPNLRSMGFKIDGDKISLSKQQRDMLLSKLGNDKFGKIFGSGEKFVEDHEIAMASNELMSIIEDAMRLLKLVRKYSEMEGLEAWQQSKITKAADYLNAVLNNLQGDATLNQEDHSNFNNGWGQTSYDTYAGSNHGRGVAEGKHTKNKLFVKKLTSEQSLIEHAKTFAKNLQLDGVPITSKNRHTVVCSTIFAHDKKKVNESVHITSGKQLIQLLKKIDQFSQIPFKVGSSVAIINAQMQGDSVELWGFTSPKTISKIYRDPSDKSIKQFEFNNDPNDVWPRTENAEYNGQFLMYSAFFGDKKSADHALTMLMLQGSGDLNIRNHITEKQQDLEEDPYMAELDARLAEKIPANAPVDVYIKDFEKSNAPQFRGKTQEKRKQMALAAYYAKKNPSKKK